MKAGAVLVNCRWALYFALAAALPARAATDVTTLTKLDLEQLLELPVVGASKYEQKQSEVAAAVSVITRDEIKAFGWRTLAEALASLPGIYTTYDRQYTYLGTRGFGVPGDLDTRILLTINGNRVNNVTFDQAPVGRDFPLDMDLIERIEFIPGPGGAVYGQNAMFGVINVVTRTGAGVDGGELAADYQSPQELREGRATWGKLFDNGLDVLVSVSGMSAAGEDRFFDFGAAGVSGVARGLDGEYDKQFDAHVAGGPWSADFINGNHRKNDPTGSYLSDPLVAGQYQGDVYTLSQLQYQDRFAGDALQVLARLFTGHEDYRSNLRFSGQWFDSPAMSDWRGGELRLLTTAVKDHKLMLGLEGQDNVHLDQAQLNPANPASDIFIPRSGYRVGLYGQDEWRLTGTLTATLGLRVDRNNVISTKASPRAALIWGATPATTLKLLYGIAYRAPNAYERDYYDGVTQVANHALTAESVNTLEFVADHRVSRDLTLRASIYKWTMPHLITLGVDPVSGLAQYQSGYSTDAHGLELSADKTWDWGGRLRSSVSLQDVTQGDGHTPLNSPKELGKLNFSSPVPAAGVRLGYEFQFDSRRRTDAGNDTGGYAISNLTLTADQWIKKLEVSLGIYNLFDKSYSEPGSHINWQNALEQDGRAVRIKISYKL